MQEKEIISNNENGRFQKYTGQASEVQLISKPDNPHITVGSKAFLSCKNIENLYLPDTLEKVEDWAFAHMKSLCQITFPAKEICFGKKVFLGCDKLQKVYLTNTSPDMYGMYNIAGNLHVYEGISHFLASMFRFFPDNSLENLKMAGDEHGQWKWLTLYDEALQTYIGRADDYDFEPAFIGWFDIEDVDDQKQHFVLQQKKHKIRLAFQRLLYSEKLSQEKKTFLQEYLLRECVLAEEMLLDKEEVCSSDIRYFRIWKEVGGLNRESVGRLLDKVSEDNPEIRGYLLKIQLEDVEKDNFFEALDL